MIFWFILIFILGIVIRQTMAIEQANLYIANKIKEDCPPHKWQYYKQPGSDDDYMKCELCGKIPGQEGGNL